MGEEMVIRCLDCGTKNRIPKERLQNRPVCGHCHAPLDELIIRCMKCGKKNRVPEDRFEDRARCGSCGEPLVNMGAPVSPVEISDGTFQREVLAHSDPVLVDCWAPWCGPCRMAEPILVELASQYAGRVKIAKLNVDDNPRTASAYNVSSIPTMLIFKDGAVVNRLVGVRPKEEIETHLQPLLKAAG